MNDETNENAAWLAAGTLSKIMIERAKRPLGVRILTPDGEDFVTHFFVFCRASGYTLSDVARRMAVSQSSLFDLKSGRRKPSFHMAIKMSEFSGIPIGAPKAIYGRP